jgi:hypothetical protein
MTANNTVKMRRTAPAIPGGPVTADVHINEIDNWAREGWEKELAETTMPSVAAPVIMQNEPIAQVKRKRH